MAGFNWFLTCSPQRGKCHNWCPSSWIPGHQHTCTPWIPGYQHTFTPWIPGYQHTCAPWIPGYLYTSTPRIPGHGEHTSRSQDQVIWHAWDKDTNYMFSLTQWAETSREVPELFYKQRCHLLTGYLMLGVWSKEIINQAQTWVSSNHQILPSPS